MRHSVKVPVFIGFARYTYIVDRVLARLVGLKPDLQIPHRNFNVANPINTSIMVMIQNRTTTWVSFHPFCSK